MTTVGMTEATAAAKSRSDIAATPAAGRGAANASGTGSTSGTGSDSVVLTYELTDTHLTALLVDGEDGSERGEARSMDLEDLSPEQIGLTVPMLWELLDRAEVKPRTVVVLGDGNTATVSPILELALGVPVIAPEAPTVKPKTAAKKAAATSKSDAQPKNAATKPITPAATARPTPAKRASPTKATTTVVPVPGKPVPAKLGTDKTETIKTDTTKSVAGSRPGKPADEPTKAISLTKAGAGSGIAATAVAKSKTAVAAKNKTGTTVAAPPVETNDPPTEEIAVVPPLVSTQAFSDSDVTAPVPVVAPVASTSAAATASTAAPATVGGKSRRGLVIAAAATAFVLAGGIGAALALSNGDPAQVPQQAPSAATQDAPSAAVAPPAAPSAEVPPPAAVPAPAVPVAPPAPPAPTADSAPAGSSTPWSNSAPPAWTQNRAPSAASPSTQAPVQQAPQSAQTYVPPPQFTVPVPVPDPNNPNATPQELQDEAWQRHWQQTGQYLEQQFG